MLMKVLNIPKHAILEGSVLVYPGMHVQFRDRSGAAWSRHVVLPAQGCSIQASVSIIQVLLLALCSILPYI